MRQRHLKGCQGDRLSAGNYRRPGRKTPHTVSSLSDPTATHRLPAGSHQRPGRKTAHTASSLPNLTATYLNDLVTGADDHNSQKACVAKEEPGMPGLSWFRINFSGRCIFVNQDAGGAHVQSRYTTAHSMARGHWITRRPTLKIQPLTTFGFWSLSDIIVVAYDYISVLGFLSH